MGDKLTASHPEGEYFTALIRLLQQELSLVQDLREAAIIQKSALEEENTEQIMAAARQQEALGVKLAALEEERQQCRQELERSLGLPAGRALKELLPLAPPESREQLADLRRQLKEGLAELKQLNATCRVLATRGLAVTRQVLRLFGQAGGQAYGPEGGIRAPNIPEGRLDRTL
ncbi:MAG TPA: flagellar protein FlgN [Desulfotomaculum sp.]|nr:flagellar protein FlgN [Desulfotomaculum sp.]